MGGWGVGVPPMTLDPTALQINKFVMFYHEEHDGGLVSLTPKRVVWVRPLVSVLSQCLSPPR